MIQFRHHPDRTVELDLSMVDEGIWYPIPYSDLAYRVWFSSDSNDIDRIEIKNEDEVDWGEEDEYDEETDPTLDTYAGQGEDQ